MGLNHRMSSQAPSQTPPKETLTVRVNGREVVVPRTMPDVLSGKPIPTTMIQACEAAGVTVPHYCYHPKLPVAGNCRMCLVEFGTPAVGPDRKPLLNPDGSPQIRKAPRPAIACATPVSPGMEIYTDTEGAKEMRRAVMEFLLINHPLDCPICDQAGECKLQEYALDHGQAASGFGEVKVHKPKAVDLGPRIMLDAERCILCSRCIRFTRDIAGDDALGIINRGSYNAIAAYPGRQFDNNYTLNTADICPVGALTSKDFRFQMRVWFLKENKSLCASCGTGCNILVGSRQNRIHRFTPRQNDAVNSCWMCDEGRLNYRWVGREDRLKTPVSRRSGATEWGPVLDEAADILRNAPRGSVAVIGSARQTCEELFLLKQLCQHLGARSDCVPREGEADGLLVSDDRNPNSHGARLMGVCFTEIGINLPYLANDIEAGKIRTLLVIGEDLTKPELELPPDLLDRLDHLIVGDILPNATVEKAHLVLPGCAHLEKRGSFINVNGRVQRFFKVVEPPGQALPEIDWLAGLRQRLTGEAPAGSVESLFNQLAEATPALKGLTWASLGDQGVTVEV
jgi:NADH-quinone oxidoreductase subunit G